MANADFKCTNLNCNKIETQYWTMNDLKEKPELLKEFRCPLCGSIMTRIWGASIIIPEHMRAANESGETYGVANKLFRHAKGITGKKRIFPSGNIPS
jgi:hypothetical protein